MENYRCKISIKSFNVFEIWLKLCTEIWFINHNTFTRCICEFVSCCIIQCIYFIPKLVFSLFDTSRQTSCIRGSNASVNPTLSHLVPIFQPQLCNSSKFTPLVAILLSINHLYYFTFIIFIIHQFQYLNYAFFYFPILKENI